MRRRVEEIVSEPESGHDVIPAPASAKNAEGRATRSLKQWIRRCSVLYF
jgi:hypothetical protein